MEYYRRFSSFYSIFLSKITCRSNSGFKKYNEPNDISLNKSVHKDIEEQNIEFNDNDEKLPSVIENNNNDSLAIDDIKMVIDNGKDDSDDGFKEFEQFKKVDQDDNKCTGSCSCGCSGVCIDGCTCSGCGVVYNYDFQDKEIYNEYMHEDTGYDITMITSNDKTINNIDDFNKNF